jgi:hypothetical protein
MLLKTVMHNLASMACRTGRDRPRMPPGVPPSHSSLSYFLLVHLLFKSHVGTSVAHSYVRRPGTDRIPEGAQKNS